MDDYKELIERLRFGNTDSETMNGAADAIESLLAENGRLKAEIAKYRDAPVVAYWYKYHNCFGDEVWATDSNWGGRTPLESNPLIVKPGEEK